MNVGHSSKLEFGGTSRFQVLSQVGQGGAGFVYEVLDRERNARLALKTLRTRNAETILHLKNEFRAVQDITHPNLVTLNELFEEAGQWFFTMEYVQGKSFLAYVRPIGDTDRRAALRGANADKNSLPPSSIASPGAFDEARLRGALTQLARGLSALHKSHKVHRDIKPSNIMVTPEGRVVILDFGIVSDLERSDEHETENEGIVGTAFYMAPEQAASEAIGPAADWYAVGTMLYQALTGRLPFTGSMHDVLETKMGHEPPAPSTLVAGIPADIDELCVDLLRLDPGARPDGREVLERLGVSTEDENLQTMRHASFVGRRAELRMLEEAFDRTCDGETITILVEGESGVGKSHLVREFTRRTANAEEVLILRGRCYERESVPYKAVDSIVDDLCRFLMSLPEEDVAAVLPDHAALLRRLFPVMDGVPLIAEARLTQVEALNPQETRARVFAVLRSLFANISLRRRLVLIVDDLQWADADSLALFSDVLRPPGAPPLMLLATIRSGTEARRHGRELFGAIDRLPGDIRRVHLEALPASDARELIGQLLEGTDGQQASTIESILAEAKGHPLFIDELVRHRSTHKDSTSPTRLDDALWDRASLLGPAERRLLELVAIAGVPMPHETIAQAAALEFGQLFGLVSTLRAGHFVRTSGVYRKDTIEAYHDRVRESVLGHVPDAARKEWHARLALALEQSPTADAEMLVTHWHGAGNKARAAEYAIRAADQAAKTLAFGHAAALYRQALDLHPVTGDEARALKLKLAEALTNAGRGADAARAYLAAAESCEHHEALTLRSQAAGQYVTSGHMDEGIALGNEVLTAAGVWVPKSRALIVLSMIFHTIWLALRGVKYEKRAAKDIAPKELLRVDCMASAGGVFGMSDHVRGKDFQVRTLLAALRVGEPERVTRALGFFAAGHASAGGPVYDKVMKHAANMSTMAEELKSPFLQGLVLCTVAYANQFTGQWPAAKKAFLEAEAIWRERCIGCTYELNSLRTLLNRCLASLGDIAELEVRATADLREAEGRNDLYTIVNVRTNPMVYLALVRDDPEEAQAEITMASRHLTKEGFFVQHAFCLLAQAYVSLYRGEPEKVSALMIDTWPTIKSSLLLHVASLRILFKDARARAGVALAVKGGAGATAARADALKFLREIERENTIWATPQTALCRAGLAHADGKKDEAIALLRAAVTGFDGATMRLQAEVARRLLGKLVGGTEGDALIAQSERWMTENKVKNAGKMVTLFAPGFDDTSS